MQSSLQPDLDHIALHCKELWAELREARLFLTGGSGFVGTWLLLSLAHANRKLGLNAQACVLSRDPEAFRRRVPDLTDCGFLQLLRGDVRSFDFPSGRFSHVIHAATPAHSTIIQEPELLVQVTIDGTRRTLDFARAAGARRFLFISSGAIYGRLSPEIDRIQEDHLGVLDPLDVAAVYGQAKRGAELLCAIYHKQHGLQAPIARCFALLGPYLPLDAQLAVADFLRDGLQERPIRVLGDGSPVRSYLYAADLVIWLWTILLRGRGGRAYNVGSEEGVTLAQLAGKIAERLQVGVEIARPPELGLPAHSYVASTRRAREELGLKTWIGLDEALDRTLRWHRQAEVAQPAQSH